MKALRARKIFGLGVMGAAMLVASHASALPFNDDMVDVQKRTGSMMRQKAPGTVALGSLSYRIEKKADAENWPNPVKGDAVSTANGKRLFAVNCLPCHGDISKKPYTPGLVGAKFAVTPPDILSDNYKTRTDGFFYGTIHFGGAAFMPPLGWKLSPTEHWDIINYVRTQQK